MKQVLCFVTVLMFMLVSNGQQILCLTTDKTTSLVFPFAIRHVDRGNQYVLAQQVKDMPTILLVKAATTDFKETNLSVVTDDGSVYSLTVCYDSKPKSWVHYLPVNNKATTAMYANGILDNQPKIKKLKEHKWKADLKVTGVYVKNDILFYQLQLQNNGPIDYTIDLVRFFIRDKKKAKRTAVQELELKPVYSVGNTTLVKAHSKSVMVFAVEKFTIPDAKYMAVQVNEKNGGRHFFIRVKNKNIMRAVVLPDYR